MLTFKLVLPVHRGYIEQFQDTIGSLLERTRAEDGCLDCRLYEDTERDNCFLMLQEWRDAVTFGRHLEGQCFRTLLVAMDMLSGSPTISFGMLSDRKVLSSVEELFETIACLGVGGGRGTTSMARLE